MNPRRRKETHDESFWSKHLKGWGDSGLTQQAYCDLPGLVLSTFQLWRRRLVAAGQLHIAKPCRCATRSWPGSRWCTAGEKAVRLSWRWQVAGTVWNSTKAPVRWRCGSSWTCWRHACDRSRPRPCASGGGAGGHEEVHRRPGAPRVRILAGAGYPARIARRALTSRSHLRSQEP